MSKLLIMSDLHLGHRNICKYRPEFKTKEEHDETLFNNLATALNKRDTVYFLGDVAFTKEWLDRIKNLKCFHKVNIVGNHDLERGLTMRDMVNTFDKCYSLLKKNHYWFSHCPIHPDEIRGTQGNIHGHTHRHIIDDPRYINMCVEHTEYRPLTIEQVKDKHKVIQELYNKRLTG